MQQILNFSLNFKIRGSGLYSTERGASNLQISFVAICLTIADIIKFDFLKI